MKSVWHTLRLKSEASGIAFTVLAPMEDVTDSVFRQIVLSQGRPDVFMTEFTNCDGLASRGRPRIIHRLEYTQDQHPIIAQIWGRNVDTYVQAIPLIVSMGFDGVDINMGCPVANVVKSGAGAGLIRDPLRAQELILSVKKAISESENPNLALSVKTRIGFDDIDFTWIEMLLKTPVDAITFHLRTKKKMSKVSAHWEVMSDILKLRDTVNPDVVVIGNGDITTSKQLKSYRQLYGVDGLMVGRGIFDNLWIFNAEKDGLQATSGERVRLVRSHIDLFLRTWGTTKNFEMIKKFFKIYLNNFDGAAVLRNQLLRVKTADEMLIILDEFDKISSS